MSLGQRGASLHDTVASRHDDIVRVAVQADTYADFAPKQRVRTIDGLLGTVTAVNDGPMERNEDYTVALDHGMGVGTYTSSQLTAAETTASEKHTAAPHLASDDYEELGDILTRRPDPSRE